MGNTSNSVICDFEMHVSHFKQDLYKLSKSFLDSICEKEPIIRVYFKDIFGFTENELEKFINLDTIIKIYILSEGGFSLNYLKSTCDDITSLKNLFLHKLISDEKDNFEHYVCELIKLLGINSSKDVLSMINIIKNELSDKQNNQYNHAKKE